MDDRSQKENSINDIIEKYSDMLIRISFTYMKNMSDAEDIAQEALIKIIEKKPSFDSSDHEKAWLIRVAINLSKNRLRTAWFRKTQPLNEEVYNFTPEESEVMEAVLELPVKYRSIILLFYFEGYKIHEIASILGEKESTIGSQLHRARQLLKSKLKEDFGNE